MKSRQDSPEFLDMTGFFNPKSIAVLGASADPRRIGGRPIKNLRAFGYTGKIYPVNPKYEAIGDITCYPSILDVPGEVDHVLISVPQKLVPEAVDQSLQKGVRFATVFGSGFGETGREGKELEERLVKTCREGGMRFCGPNCQGMINLVDGVAASFTPALETNQLVPGPIGFVSQSGAFAGSIFNFAQQRNMGLSYWVSMGNMGDLDAADYIMAMIRDERTRVVGAYIEGFRDKEKLFAVAAEAIKRKKQIVVLKGGASRIGAKASVSHTGSIAGSDEICTAALEQWGIIRVEGIEELFDAATLFTTIPYAPEGGLTIVTTSGAAGVILCDQAEKYGLELLDLPEVTKDKLKEILPEFGSSENPIDLTAQSINHPEITSNTIRALAEEPKVGLLIIMFTMVVGRLADMWSKSILDIRKSSDKPMVVCWMATNMAEKEMNLLKESNLAVFETPVRCMRAVKSLYQYSRRARRLSRRKRAQPQVDQERKGKVEAMLRGKGPLTEYQAQQILSAYGIPFPKGRLAKTVEEAQEIAGEIGYPVALKVQSPELLHKTEAGLVHLNIQDENQLREAYDALLARARAGLQIQGVLVQRMVEGQSEVIAGVIRDPQFGHTVMFGMGGIYVEILRDVSFGMPPLGREDAEEMIRQVKGFKILEGARGRKKADVASIVDILLGLSQLIEEVGENILEVDLNPIIVSVEGKGGARTVDVLIQRA